MLQEFCNCLWPKATLLGARSPRRQASPPRSSEAESPGCLRSAKPCPCPPRKWAGCWTSQGQPPGRHSFAKAGRQLSSRTHTEERDTASAFWNPLHRLGSIRSLLCPFTTPSRFPGLQTATPSIHSLTGRVVQSCTAQHRSPWTEIGTEHSECVWSKWRWAVS